MKSADAAINELPNGSFCSSLLSQGGNVADGNRDYVATMNEIVTKNLFISEKALKRKLKAALNIAGVKATDFQRAVCDDGCTFRKVDVERASHYAISENVYYDIRWSQKSGCPEVCIYPEDMIAWTLYHEGVLPVYEKSSYGENTFWGIVDEKLKDVESSDKSWDGIIDKAASHYQTTFVNCVLGLEKIAHDYKRHDLLSSRVGG